MTPELKLTSHLSTIMALSVKGKDEYSFHAVTNSACTVHEIEWRISDGILKIYLEKNEHIKKYSSIKLLSAFSFFIFL